MLSRRDFVSWLSTVGAALGIGARSRAEPAPARAPTEPQSPSLDGAALRAVAEAVLPEELGKDGSARVARAFSQWAAGYREGAELNHPYGSAQIRSTGASPLNKWRDQLAALDRNARAKHQGPFTSLTRGQRTELLTAALSVDRVNRLPDPLEANHVALALMSWFFTSTDANDLCYDAKIGRNSCRPLVNAPRKPLPIKGQVRT